MGFNIIVPIKYVPDIEKVRFDVEAGRIDRSSAEGEINPFDLNALEAGVRIKEKYGGSVTVVSMGPPPAEKALRDALARGADMAILLSDVKFAGADTLATSYAISCAIRKIGSYDLIICGEKTVDGDTGQVGAEIAEFLGLPHSYYVSEIREISDEYIRVVSDFGDAYYLVELRLPALISVTKDINFPRLPTFKDKMRARRAEVTVWKADMLTDICDVDRFGFKGSPTVVSRVIIPKEQVRECCFIKEEDAVDRIIEVLKDRGVI